MGNINVSRVLLGGLAAGVVGNVIGFLGTLVMGDRMTEAMADLGVAPIGTSQQIVFIVMGFVAGIVAVWIYAAMRPRFGAGIKTALIAAVTLWIVASLMSAVGFGVLGLFPASLMTLGTILDLITIVIAMLVGAWLYTE